MGITSCLKPTSLPSRNGHSCLSEGRISNMQEGTEPATHAAITSEGTWQPL